jgi:hypothetical protein
MNETLRSAVTFFRFGMEGTANAAFTKLLDGLSPYLARRPDKTDELVPVLREVLAAQSRGDYLYVADLLEYELGPRLSLREEG